MLEDLCPPCSLWTHHVGKPLSILLVWTHHVGRPVSILLVWTHHVGRPVSILFVGLTMLEDICPPC